MVMLKPKAKRRFELGQVCMTPGAQKVFEPKELSPTFYLACHVMGDWGDVDDHDKEVNEYAVKHGERILSVYTLPDLEGTKIWIITERDRSVTTILTPEEY